MRGSRFAVFTLCASAFTTLAFAVPTTSPRPSASPTYAPAPSPSPSPKATVTPTKSPTPSPSPKPTVSPTKTPTPSPSPSPKPSSTPKPKLCCGCGYVEPASGPCGAIGNKNSCLNRPEQLSGDEVYCLWNSDSNRCESVFRNFCLKWVEEQGCPTESTEIKPVAGVSDWSAFKFPSDCTSTKVQIAGHGNPDMCGGFFSSLENQLAGLSPGCSQISVDSISCSLFQNKSEVAGAAESVCQRLHPNQHCSVSGNMCNNVLDYFCNEVSGGPTRLTVCIDNTVTTNHQPCYEAGSYCTSSVQNGQTWTCKAPDGKLVQQTCCSPQFGFGQPTGPANPGEYGGSTWTMGAVCPVSCNPTGQSCSNPGKTVSCGNGQQQSCCQYGNQTIVASGGVCPSCGTYNASMYCYYQCVANKGYARWVARVEEYQVMTGLAACTPGPTDLKGLPSGGCGSRYGDEDEIIKCEIKSCDVNQCSTPSPTPSRK